MAHIERLEAQTTVLGRDVQIHQANPVGLLDDLHRVLASLVMVGRLQTKMSLA
jgi:hypothetical protein